MPVASEEQRADLARVPLAAGHSAGVALAADLTDEQSSLAFAPQDEHVVSSAVAGAGKTNVLVKRIVWLVRECKVPLERILAVSFSQKASAEIRKRVMHDLGASPAFEQQYKKSFATMHAFCRRILAGRRDAVTAVLKSLGRGTASTIRSTRAANKIVITPESYLLNGVKKLLTTLLKNCPGATLPSLSAVDLANFSLDQLQHNPQHSPQQAETQANPKKTYDFMRLLKSLKARGVEPSSLQPTEQSYEHHGHTYKNHQVFFKALFVQYNAMLVEKGWFDFEDLVILAAGVLAMTEVVEKEQRQLSIVMIDESQDFSSVQWNVIEALLRPLGDDARARPRLFAVGDVRTRSCLASCMC